MKSFDEEKVANTAAEWLARQDAGFSAAESAEFERWVASDPRHAAAVDELTAAWATVNLPRERGRANHVFGELSARASRRRRRRLTFGLTSMGLAAAAAFVFLVSPPFPPPGVDVTAPTVVVRPDRQTLVDGSVVELNSATDIRVEFSTTQRTVHLVRGEAHFAVTKDPARPFVVFAGAVEVRAVGTEFAVKFAPEVIDVVVTEGQVAVARNAAPAESSPRTPVAVTEPMLVGAGERVIIPEARDVAAAPLRQELKPEEVDASLAWRGKRVEFTGTPLADVIALFNRQNRVQFVLDDLSLAAVRVSGIYWIDDPEGFARLLESGFDLNVERRDATTLALRKAR